MFTPADLAIVKLAPTTPRLLQPRVPAVKHAKPAGGRNTIRAFLAESRPELYGRLGDFERRVIKGSVVLRWDLGQGDGIAVARKSTDETQGGETIGTQLDAVAGWLRLHDEILFGVAELEAVAVGEGVNACASSWMSVVLAR